MQRKARSKTLGADATPTTTAPGQMLRKQEMAAKLGVCVRTLDERIAKRELPYFKFGRLILFDWQECQEALRRNFRIPAAGEPKRKIGRVEVGA